MPDTSKLEALGFVRAGGCVLAPELKSGVRFKLHSMREKRAIYAFSINALVAYVGVCDSSSTVLADRMGRYQSMVGAGTNERIAKLVKKALESGAEVGIWAWVPIGELQVTGLSADLIKGLEFPLIAALQPSWNIRS